MIPHSLWNNAQLGFLTGKRTETALFKITKRILEVLDNGDATCGLFLDMSKAFDCLDHNLLLEKLQYHGIGDIVLNWMKSYLINRKQQK